MGDFTADSVAGKVYTVFLIVFGIGLISIVIGKTADSLFLYRKLREEGRLSYKKNNHLVIVGWTKKAKFAVEEALKTNGETDVVVIDKIEKMETKDGLFYIQGHASEEEILEKANIKEAKAALIFADDQIQDDEIADGKTLMIATSIERYSDEIYTIVEIRDEKHVKNFAHIKVNEFILTNEMISNLAVRSAFSNGISTIFSQLLSHNTGQDLYEIPKKRNWVTYRDAFEELLVHGVTLIADRNDLSINEKLDLPIPKEAKLIAFCSKKNYKKITSS
jgi:voltage-gated potassium channel